MKPLLAILIASAASAQPAFEVASVKPANPIDSKAMIETKLAAGLQVQGTRVDATFISLADLIRLAYRLKTYQLSAPAWLSSERYDVHARMAETATKDQVPEMLQSLLADRFKLAFHRDSKENSVYALVVAKTGLKMKEADSTPPPPSSPTAPAAKPLTKFSTPASVGTSIAR